MDDLRKTRWSLWAYPDDSIRAHPTDEKIIKYKGKHPPAYICDVEPVTLEVQEGPAAVPPWIGREELLEKVSELSDKYMHLAEKYSRAIDQVIVARDALEKLKTWGSQMKIIEEALHEMRPR